MGVASWNDKSRSNPGRYDSADVLPPSDHTLTEVIPSRVTRGLLMICEIYPELIRIQCEKCDIIRADCISVS